MGIDQINIVINDGYKAAAIHGDLSQNQRDAVMQSFRKKKIQLLIATDVAARGIDVDDITHIINYRLPDEIETYTHRSGRTGRAGKQGVSIIFATKSEEKKIRLIEKKLNINVPRKEMPSYEVILNSKVDSWIDEIKKTPINSNLKSYLPGVIKSFKREVNKGWDQPMFTEPGYDGGILGLLKKDINKSPHYLINAKFEPGNYRFIQLSPTVQATFSNIKRSHGGREVKYLKYFKHPKKNNCKVIFKQWVSEEGGRLKNKRNLGILVEHVGNCLLYTSDAADE